MIEASVAELTPTVGTAGACRALGVPRPTVYRWRKPKVAPPPREERLSPRALSHDERRGVLDVLHSDRFADVAPGYWRDANAQAIGDLPVDDALIATTKDWKRRKALREQGPPRGRIPAGISPVDRMERRLRTKTGGARQRPDWISRRCRRRIGRGGRRRGRPQT